ncbi:IclR family transcriptional regulator [Thalassovita taeanensis]|uniref:Transcriptional regulator, IclR family n=1 Tax=Thalassovita taeanensis TaxID=657014 RepID=A0A1H9B866_9RHOB|nr:IclR family transcriptional regulator [Thalassovita taeanensis]SEP84863.1 transcriptional regulator, IclR family [Thalassovita taeanensis]
MRKRTASDTGEEPAENEHSGDRQFVTALHRGLDILRAFRPADIGGLGNRELAERTGLPNSTVSRLTYTLLKLGYLVYDEDTGRYRMGLPVLSLGYACLDGMKIRETAQPYMQRLADDCGDGVLVALGGRDDMSMSYIACARSTMGMVSLQLNVGSRISLARSAMGRAYIAGTTETERAQIMERIQDRTPPADWPRMRDEILDAAEQIRTQGFYVSMGKWQPDVHAVSVPYRSVHGHTPMLAFNLGGPGYILPRERLVNDLGPKLVQMTQMIARTGV